MAAVVPPANTHAVPSDPWMTAFMDIAAMRNGIECNAVAASRELKALASFFSTAVPHRTDSEKPKYRAKAHSRVPSKSGGASALNPRYRIASCVEEGLKKMGALTALKLEASLAAPAGKGSDRDALHPAQRIAPAGLNRAFFP
eukprot:CAMPEP_0198331478 /NCGR_PEP_ID=MMETSP1450-20131203/17622_1 /TAXON_ID=753684 ORGANISM="Madagascaria erythrocladiodes, Strain CCMP3234" /NCGR_SAMPLE_ID=MMETSP1450 /ASSEMBLY_ACC=CAM_ASM_001115 /LENGTH=142 /DNA_ID=CAMNT_0044035857 /DNA_START=332 /DNA_END=757 /DNA_ORIENTATION=-